MPVLANAKHELFAQELAKGKTADEAYVLAGFKANRGNAATLKAKQSILDRVNEILERAAVRAEITVARVLEELGKIGFSNMADYMRSSDQGDPYLDFSALTRDQAAALSEVTVEDFKEGRGENARDVRRVKFKLADKRAALVDIGKHLGMFKERVELSGDEDNPVKIESDAQFGAIAGALESLARAKKGGSGGESGVGKPS
jgi:phage terminase small subunit